MVHLKRTLCVKIAPALLRLELNTTSGWSLKQVGPGGPPKSATLEEGMQGSATRVHSHPSERRHGSRAFSACRVADGRLSVQDRGSVWEPGKHQPDFRSPRAAAASLTSSASGANGSRRGHRSPPRVLLRDSEAMWHQLLSFKPEAAWRRSRDSPRPPLMASEEPSQHNQPTPPAGPQLPRG